MFLLNILLILCSTGSFYAEKQESAEHQLPFIKTTDGKNWNYTWFPDSPNETHAKSKTNHESSHTENLTIKPVTGIESMAVKEVDKSWTKSWFPHAPNSTDPFLKDVSKQTNKDWKGKWFPHEPRPIDPVEVDRIKKMHDKHPDILKMGVPDAACDDAQTNLFLDFDPHDVTFHELFLCTRQYKDFMPQKTVKANHLEYHIPEGYRFKHICMNESIEYKETIPTYGDHRRLWAAWGEYKFLPKQRWVHNLEHGGIVMLYHPCALRSEVEKLRNLVTGCLYRHIITPYPDLSAKRPLALVAWGNSLEMSVVSDKVVVKFIKKYALNAPEKLPDQGQYSHMLVKDAGIVSDHRDSRLCPYVVGINPDENNVF